MFDTPFDFFSLVIAIVAFIFARKAFNQVAELRARLDALEATGGSVDGRPAAAARAASSDRSIGGGRHQGRHQN